MAEKAGPAGSVVDQALAANVSAAVSEAGTLTPPARMSRRMTSPMASTAGTSLYHVDGEGAERAARVARNPRTGEAVEVTGKAVPYFKPGKEMRARLNV